MALNPDAKEQKGSHINIQTIQGPLLLAITNCYLPQHFTQPTNRVWPEKFASSLSKSWRHEKTGYERTTTLINDIPKTQNLDSLLKLVEGQSGNTSLHSLLMQTLTDSLAQQLNISSEKLTRKFQRYIAQMQSNDKPVNLDNFVHLAAQQHQERALSHSFSQCS